MAAIANSNDVQRILFDEISEGLTVRYTTVDGKLYMSVRDIVMCVCGKDNNQAGQVWRNLSIDVKNELRDFIDKFQFPGRGQSVQPVVALEGAIKLIMVLPGQRAKNARGAFAKVLTRYCEGDMSLCEEISKNKLIGPLAICKSMLTSSLKLKRPCRLPVAQWLYGTQSNAFTAVIKIGRTRNLKQRLSSGNTFCAISKHVVVAAVPTFNPARDERTAHEHFAKRRCVGEFFRVTKEDVQRFFNRHIMPQYQLELAEMISQLH